ncbi:RNA pseudouridine synthase [Halosquirtibacter xylanolyticus]|uniref:RluA family pseudouridine synthase n=1 Tax=Halosquirtibacter xylanolyticus TaxID=3374599 RepID=UPI0037479E75|nr:RNA pseudouridine synthase [Prolixibacteraceae bacterium]
MYPILFEDNHLIAVNKPSGAIVQGDQTGDSPMTDVVKAFIKKRDNKPGNVYLGLPHRLDRPTSGVLLLSKTSKALTRLNKMFQSKSDMQKTYWVVVDKKPEVSTQRLEHFMVRNTKQNKSYAYLKDRPEAKKAALTYRYLGSSTKYHLLEVDLHTGRHHQIRAQLAAIGLHIKGDLKYGASRSNPDGGIHLHARNLSFMHPVTKEAVNIVATPPDDAVWNFFAKNY